MKVSGRLNLFRLKELSSQWLHINRFSIKMSAKRTTFKVLEYNQMIMARIGIHSHNLDDPSNEFYTNFISYYFLFVIIFLIFGSIVFVCINWPQYNVISDPCLIAVGCMQVGGMFLGFGLKMKTVKQLHLELQEFVDAGTYCSSFFTARNERWNNISWIFIFSCIYLFSLKKRPRWASVLHLLEYRAKMPSIHIKFYEICFCQSINVWCIFIVLILLYNC